MEKNLYVQHAGKPVQARIRRYTLEDAEALIEVQRLSFPPPYPEELLWSREQLAQHVSRFPEGALCAVIGGKIIGSMTGMRVHSSGEHEHLSWAEATDDGFIRNHVSDGDTLYVVDICIVPEYRQTGLGKWLMQTMYETVVHLGISRLLGGGRLPGYHRHAAAMSAEAYVAAVLTGELRDPVLTFLLRCGRTPAGIASNYLDDEESCGYAAMMEWRNPFIRS
ncbi:GNAT family N-acetyltransferase [Paenibacillus pasadenensis]|uniref:GNAT family N-acetyltransferase n=1 Tax=Paenibacillus pasadenensis TaxID=217090 RepID=UPI00203CF949|nr:GNAT family N-acetyltransferase [Paenibacillus pasadenensis]MCM3748937.1 GNAT family N-acetyltransferase [Paenibacillus pasadenensis]